MHAAAPICFKLTTTWSVAAFVVERHLGICCILQVSSESTPKKRLAIMASEDAAVEDHDAEEEQAEHAQNVQDEVDDADMEQNSEVENPSSALSSTSASGSHASHESTNRLAMLLSQPDAEINQEIKRLKQVRERMKKDKQKVTVEIRNSKKKRSRLKQRARLLSTNDLLEVYAMRVRAQDQRDSANESAEHAQE